MQLWFPSFWLQAGKGSWELYLVPAGNIPHETICQMETDRVQHALSTPSLPKTAKREAKELTCPGSMPALTPQI